MFSAAAPETLQSFIDRRFPTDVPARFGPVLTLAGVVALAAAVGSFWLFPNDACFVAVVPCLLSGVLLPAGVILWRGVGADRAERAALRSRLSSGGYRGVRVHSAEENRAEMRGRKVLRYTQIVWRVEVAPGDGGRPITVECADEADAHATSALLSQYIAAR